MCIKNTEFDADFESVKKLTKHSCNRMTETFNF